MLKSSSRLSNWIFGSPNSESGCKSYANYKFQTHVVQTLQAGRPGTFAKHILRCYKTIRDPTMHPYALDIQANTKDMTERPSTWIKGPICSNYRDLLAQSTTMDFMHPSIKMLVKREAEMCQTQPGRSRRSQAGRPHFAVSHAHLHVVAMSTDPLAYK
jgi:hypothetical protein